MSSATRNENRLSDEDRVRIRAAAVEFVDQFRRPLDAGDQVAAMRVMAHAIGCGLHDLRESELDELTATLLAASFDAQPTHPELERCAICGAQRDAWWPKGSGCLVCFDRPDYEPPTLVDPR